MGASNPLTIVKSKTTKRVGTASAGGAYGCAWRAPSRELARGGGALTPTLVGGEAVRLTLLDEAGEGPSEPACEAAPVGRTTEPSTSFMICRVEPKEM